jgi:hypothetical protein
LLRQSLNPVLNAIAELLGFSPILQDISSDSVLFVMLHLLLLVSALIFASLSILTKKVDLNKLNTLAKTIFAFYLSMILLRYGFDKIFLLQFPEPEPNLLFTPFGKLDRDILYWSVMGIGKGYSVFIGIAEILAGILLLFKKTRELGAFMAFMILLNVVAINVGFDISVKVFSSMLTLMALFLCFPVFELLFRHFIKRGEESTVVHVSLSNQTPSRSANWLKMIALLIIILEVGSPYVSLIKETKPTTLQTTAFEVPSVECAPHSKLPKRIFLHSDNYLILQMEDLETISFPVYNCDKDEKKWLIKIDGQFTQVQITTNTLGYENLNCKSLSEVPIALKRIDHTKMPALQSSFHLTVDQTLSK